MAWLLGPIILLVVRDQWRKDKETKTLVAQAAALANEKDVVLARINDLPAWVINFDIFANICLTYIIFVYFNKQVINIANILQET